MKILPVLIATALCTLVSTEARAQRISIADFSGPKASGVRNQLVTAVCDTADCIAPAKATTRNKPDWKKAKKNQVKFVVTGTVAKKSKSVELQIFEKQGAPKAKKSWPLEKNGTLSAKNLQAAIELMQGAFGVEESTTPPVAATTPVEPTPTPTATQAAAATTATAAAASPAPAPKPAEPEPAPAKEEKKAKKKWSPPFLAIEVGTSLLSRKLDYVEASTPNLRRYELPLFPQIDARLEFYPAALATDGALAGLGVDFGIGLAPYLKSRRQSSSESYPTSTMRITGGVRYRWMPFDSYKAAFIPMVGINIRSFTVGAASDGSTLDGLPDTNFVGLRAGLGLELPIIPDLLLFFGRFCAIPVFSSGELVSAAYFPNGSTFGLDANAGLALKIFFLQIRLAFEFEQYSSKFTTEPTDTYVATGSVDRYIGGSVALRFEF